MRLTVAVSMSSSATNTDVPSAACPVTTRRTRMRRSLHVPARTSGEPHHHDAQAEGRGDAPRVSARERQPRGVLTRRDARNDVAPAGVVDDQYSSYVAHGVLRCTAARGFAYAVRARRAHA